jgi:hypothetical protein
MTLTQFTIFTCPRFKVSKLQVKIFLCTGFSKFLTTEANSRPACRSNVGQWFQLQRKTFPFSILPCLNNKETEGDCRD